MSNYIRVPYAMTVHDENEVQAVTNQLRLSTQMGDQTRLFESSVAKIYGKKFGLAVNSGSSALFLATEIMNLPRGSNVITPVLTFATTVGCIVKNGLIPNFIDVKAGNDLTIDEDLIKKNINSNTSAMVVPNLMGNYPNFENLKYIADKHNLLILEDSADIIGAKYKGQNTGNLTDITTSSFYGMHIINCAGNGGIICINNKEMYEKAKLLRSWGRSSSLFNDSESIENRFNISVDNIEYDAKFIFEEIGYNLEPSEIGSVFGLEQLKKLEIIIEKRKNNSLNHNNFFSKYLDYFELPSMNKDVESVWFAYPLLIKPNAPFKRKEIQIFLEKRNIQTRVIFTGNITRQPGFTKIDCIKSQSGYPNADKIMEFGFLIACHHGLTQEMNQHIYDSFDLFFNKYIN